VHYSAFCCDTAQAASRGGRVSRDHEAVDRLFDPTRDPDERVREDDWHPTPKLAGISSTSTTPSRTGAGVPKPRGREAPASEQCLTQPRACRSAQASDGGQGSRTVSSAALAAKDPLGSVSVISSPSCSTPPDPSGARQNSLAQNRPEPSFSTPGTS